MVTSSQKRSIFLTGATGLIGSYLLKILLQNGHKVFVLVRNSVDKNANERVIDVLNFWDKEIYQQYQENLTVLKGDITDNNLDLSEKDLSVLRSNVEEIFHCAAAIVFNLPLEKIRTLNLDGTRNVLNISLSCMKLKKVNHLSTVYICGDYNGFFKQTDLNVGQKFNTNYEQSKFEAEKLIEEYRAKGLWVDIYRPALVMGELTTGKTFQFKHAYQFLQLATSGIFNSLPLEGAKLNFVPVDFVAEFIYNISCLAKERNQNYHAFPLESSFFISDFLTCALKVIKFKYPKIVSISEFKSESLTAAQKIMLKNNLFVANTFVRLDGASKELISKYGLKFPEPSFLIKEIEYAKEKGFLRDHLR